MGSIIENPVPCGQLQRDGLPVELDLSIYSRTQNDLQFLECLFLAGTYCLGVSEIADERLDVRDLICGRSCVAARFMVSDARYDLRPLDCIDTEEFFYSHSPGVLRKFSDVEIASEREWQIVGTADIKRWNPVAARIEPRAECAPLYDRQYGVFRALYERNRDLMAQLDP